MSQELGKNLGPKKKTKQKKPIGEQNEIHDFMELTIQKKNKSRNSFYLCGFSLG